MDEARNQWKQFELSITNPQVAGTLASPTLQPVAVTKASTPQANKVDSNVIALIKEFKGLALKLSNAPDSTESQGIKERRDELRQNKVIQKYEEFRFY